MNELNVTEPEKMFRISFKTEELRLIEEALTQLYVQIGDTWNSGKKTSMVYEKKMLAEKLLFNFRLLLAGNKKTGRRRAYRPWNEEHRQLMKELV